MTAANSKASVGIKAKKMRDSKTKKHAEKRDLKLKKHRESMVGFRLKKKEQYSSLQREHRQLERTMKFYLSVETSINCMYNVLGAHAPTKSVRDLIVEKETLRRHNLALSKEVEHHKRLLKLLSVKQCASEHEDPLLPVSEDDAGWWVHFAEGAPSFYFHPFSADVLEAIANPFNHGFTADLPASSLAGTFLGWTVHRQLSSHNELHNGKLSSRVRLTKRVQCSLDTAYNVAVGREKDLRPLLVAPRDWSFTQRDEISIQVLQEINVDTRVMVHNVPGDKDVRYVFLARTAQWELQGGRRKMGFCMVVIDSEANRLSRDAEMPQDNIEWVTEGWALCTMTEIEDNAVDVVYEHCAGCESEAHAGLLLAQWAHFIVRWEQIVFPTSMLPC